MMFVACGGARSLSNMNSRKARDCLIGAEALGFALLTTNLQIQAKQGRIRQKEKWQGKKDSNLRMPESESGALTSLATPLSK